MEVWKKYSLETNPKRARLEKLKEKSKTEMTDKLKNISRGRSDFYFWLILKYFLFCQTLS